jgi:hypothetical protein
MTRQRRARHANERLVDNPTFYFDIIKAGYPVEELKRRVMRITLVDNARGYDEISVDFLNNDGLMTDVRHLALGFVFRVRLGYYGDTSGWKSFLVSRVKGGVGVMGPDEPRAVDQANAVVTFSGRNRNAPDLKKRVKTKAPRVTGKGRGTQRGHRGAATRQVLALNNAYSDGWQADTITDRVLGVRRLSDAAKEIARRLGYPSSKIFVEETEDLHSEIVIPHGVAPIEWLEAVASKLGDWTCEAKKEFRFHTSDWDMAKKAPRHSFTYGGPDIINLQTDFDFRLPVPNELLLRGYSPRQRTGTFGSVKDKRAGAARGQGGTGALVYTGDLAGISPDKNDRLAQSRARARSISRTHSYPFAAGPGALKHANNRALKSFRSKNLRAVKMGLTIVGNPDVWAKDKIEIKGTGNQLVDGVWFAKVVRHVFNGSTYVTQVDLEQSKKARGAQGILRFATTMDRKAGLQGRAAQSALVVKGSQAAETQLFGPTAKGGPKHKRR